MITSVRVETLNSKEVPTPQEHIDVSLSFMASSSPAFISREKSVEGDLLAESISKYEIVVS